MMRFSLMQRAMRSIAAVLLIGLLAGTGCATPPSSLTYEDWTARDASEQKFATDHADCSMASQVPMSLVGAGGNAMRMDIDDEAFEKCMGQQGWQINR